MSEQVLEPSLSSVVLLCLRRRRLILGVVAMTAAAGVAWTLLTAPRYRACAKILVTTNQVNISSSADRSTEFVQRTALSPEELNSQIEILRSASLVGRVLEDMDDGRGATSSGRFGGVLARLGRDGGPDPGSLVAGVLHAVDVGVVGRSNVIEVAFTDYDPAWARDFVNRLTVAYVDRHARLQQLSDAEDFFTRQSDVLWRKVADSETALRDLRRRTGVLPGYDADVRARLGEFSAELSRTRIAIEEHAQLVDFLRRMAAADGRASKNASPEVLALEAKRAEMLGRYQPGSARVREVEAQLRSLRGALASYDAGAGAPGDDLRDARAKEAALQARERALAKRVEAYEEEVQAIAAQSLELARLERQLKFDEEAYLSYIRSAEESRLSNALQQSTLLRLRIIEPATLPLSPVAPEAARVLMVALAGGLVAGFAAAVLRDRLDQSIRTAGDVRRWARLEVLAVLPERA